MTNFWSVGTFVLPLEEIVKLSPEIAMAYVYFEKILEATGVDIEDFAGVEDDYGTIEQAVIKEGYEDMSADEIYDLINKRWEKVSALVFKKTSMVVHLYYPGAEIINVDRNTYCVVDNAYVPNPEISIEIQKKINPIYFTFGN